MQGVRSVISLELGVYGNCFGGGGKDQANSPT